MRSALEKFYEFLDRPLYLSSRLVLALLVIPLVIGASRPL